MKKSIYVLIMALVVGIGAKAASYVNGDLSAYVLAATDGEDMTLTGDSYTWNTSIAIDKSVTIVASPALTSRPTITYAITLNATSPAVTGSMMTFTYSKPNTLILDGLKFVYTTTTNLYWVSHT